MGIPEGKRRTTYQERLEGEILPNFAGRVLAFDLATSKIYAELMARAKANGKAIAKADDYIAATAAKLSTISFLPLARVRYD